MPKNRLQQYFPMIRTRQEVMNIIQSTPYLLSQFHGWESACQEEFLDFCTGERGIKILYDTFFKEIINPEYNPQRLESMLQAILRQKVKILHILPNDSTRIGDETSLLITDIVVELDDHSIANIEIQKIGYHFPGQRSACYSADLLLRQYKRLRDKKKKRFNYKDVQTVYTIIFFEHSTVEFHDFPDTYLHYFSQKSDTGLELDLLQEYYFIPLDIYRENVQNRGIRTELDAWLAFLTTDDPEIILKLIEVFPEFKALYQDIYDMCRNIEGVMNMFSKELLELDRNTVQFMIDELQNEVNEKKRILEQTKQDLEFSQAELESSKAELESSKAELESSKKLLELTSRLALGGRLEDLKQATADEVFRMQLYAEYHLL